MSMTKFKHYFACPEFVVFCFLKIGCVSFFNMLLFVVTLRTKAEGPVLMILLLGYKGYQKFNCLYIRSDTLGATYNSVSLYRRSTVAPNCIRFGA